MARLTRRSFLKGSAFVGAGAAMMGLAGCGGSGDGGSGSASGEGKKKILRYGQVNAKLGIDMQKSTSSQSSSVADCCFEAPLRWTEENELVPCLLTEVPTFEDDGVTLKCTLKGGIKFHDGTTLTANDVKYTFERMFKPETGAKSTYMYDMIKGAKDMLAGTATELEGLTVEDDTHFTFVLESPMVTFINNLGISYAHIFPQKACEEAADKWGWGTNCVGTGKYKVVENDDTNEVKFEKFADYHDGEPNLDEVHIVYYDDENTRLLAFKNGDIDWTDVSATMLGQYSQDPDFKDAITLYETLGVHFVNLNLNNDALKDPKVREALCISIDRQALIDNTLAGAGIPAGCWLAPQTPGHDDAATFEYDVDKAKKLLADAGVSGLKLDCKVRAGMYEKYMTVIQDFWKKIGVELSVSVEDPGVWSSDWADGNLQTTALAWFPLYADADNHMYTYFYSENAAKKSSFYKSDKFDKLVSEARVEQDKDKRAELYKEADHILTHEDFATIPLYWPKNSFAAKSYVKNAKVGNLIYHMFDIDIDTSDPNYTTA